MSVGSLFLTFLPSLALFSGPGVLAFFISHTALLLSLFLSFRILWISFTMLTLPILAVIALTSTYCAYAAPIQQLERRIDQVISDATKPWQDACVSLIFFLFNIFNPWRWMTDLSVRSRLVGQKTHVVASQ